MTTVTAVADGEPQVKVTLWLTWDGSLGSLVLRVRDAVTHELGNCALDIVAAREKSD